MLQLTFKRHEIKYLLSTDQYHRLREAMEAYMIPDEWGASTVCNVYYDTSSRLLVRRSAEHPAYKEKVRIRCYGELEPHDPVFVEIKKKYDGVVYKRRCTMSMDRAQAMLAGRGEPHTQIERELDFTCRRYGGLQPSFFIAYDRMAFYAKDDHEFRMTFDQRVRSRSTKLRLVDADDAEQYLEDGAYLLEVKAGGAIPLWLVSFLSEEGLRKVSFSKVGQAYALELARTLGPATTQPRHLRRAEPMPYPSARSVSTLYNPALA